MRFKRGQEEMVGFALIIVIVSVILLVFLSFLLRDSNNVEIKSYEVQGFLQAVLQTTSECEDSREFLTIKDLIFIYGNAETCSDGNSAQEVLKSTLIALCEESWNVGEDAPIKGYELKIVSETTEFPLFKEGEETKNYRGASEQFTKRGEDYEIYFKAYYS
jgi:hypothetical protein